MQITIVQAEIEQAIRDYVGSKLKVADGMEMSIDLSATRGSEGFKATIDIKPITSDTKTTITAPALVAPKPAVFKPSVVASAPAPEPETKGEDAPFETEQPVEETQAEAGPAVEEKAAGEGEAQPVEEVKTDAPAQQTAAGGNSRSLFKGLTKPKNN